MPVETSNSPQAPDCPKCATVHGWAERAEAREEKAIGDLALLKASLNGQVERLQAELEQERKRACPRCDGFRAKIAAAERKAAEAEAARSAAVEPLQVKLDQVRAEMTALQELTRADHERLEQLGGERVQLVWALNQARDALRTFVICRHGTPDDAAEPCPETDCQRRWHARAALEKVLGPVGMAPK